MTPRQHAERDPSCTNCGQPLSHHTHIDFLCPSDFNDGDPDMSFGRLPSVLTYRPLVSIDELCGFEREGKRNTPIDGKTKAAGG